LSNSSTTKSELAFLDKLERIFLAEGYTSLTVGALAKRLRCSRRRLYAIADTKEELFLCIVDRCFRRLREDARRAALAEADLEKRIRVYLEAGVSRADMLRPLFLQDIACTAEGRRLFDSHQRERQTGLRLIVEEGVTAGVFRDVHAHVVAEILFLAFRRVREPDFLRDAGMSFAEALSEVSRILRHGLLHRDR
jgi:AcrR family transcriptional regulator